MNGISFNPNVNPTPVEVFNETPATGAAATQGTEGKPTLTQVRSAATDPAGVSLQTHVTLPAPDAQVQADPVEGAQTAVAGLEQMPPGSGVAASGLQQMASLQGQATALATLAATPGADPKAVAELAGQVEAQAGNLAAAFRDVVENSTYPNFTDVLKELMSLAQELKEAASQVKMAAIEGKYDLQMAGADKLRSAAYADASGREKNIKGERTAAWVSLGTSVVGAGISLGGIGRECQQALSSVGQSVNQGGSALGTLFTTGAKLEASADTLTADLLRSDKAELDAEATRQDAGIQTAEEMEQAAKALREAALQGLGTLISNHSQILRSAAEV